MYETIQQRFYSSYCNSISPKVGEATGSLGRSHSSDEVPVMGMERGASVIRSDYFETTQKRMMTKEMTKSFPVSKRMIILTI